MTYNNCQEIPQTTHFHYSGSSIHQNGKSRMVIYRAKM